MDKIEKVIVFLAIIVMVLYFLIATPIMMDDGNHYEGFTESLARGEVDFKSFYGFHGLSILSVLVFWLTGSKISIIITSAILYLLSLPLAYFVSRDFYGDRRAGIYFMILILLIPYTYTTMMRGFQEAALLFFILLIIYGSFGKKVWTPVAWAVGGIVKPFALVLFPLFAKEFLSLKMGQVLSKKASDPFKVVMVLIALVIGLVYLGVSYYQTGHLVNNAAINSYQGNFDTGNPPPLAESFTFEIKGYLRVIANILLSFRKIMISPLVVVLGGLALLLNKSLRLRKEIIVAIVLNFLLVGSLSFSFSKYLLPMTVLLALSSVGYLLKHKWLMILVFVDSFFVFLPVWDYFGRAFWDNIYAYLIPVYLAIGIYLFVERNNFQFKI